jgi:hypothetical protein
MLISPFPENLTRIPMPQRLLLSLTAAAEAAGEVRDVVVVSE